MEDLLHNIVLRQKKDIGQILKDSTVHRDGAASLADSLKRKLVKAITGPRRSGKSSIVHQVLTNSGENYAYFNFEDEQIPINIEFESLNKALENVYPGSDIYFFDEIQVLPRWEQLINRLERNGKRIIITGSNSKLLSSELSSSLTGRHELFEIYPFSYAEYCSATKEPGESFEVLKKYLSTGGFPDVVTKRVHQQRYLRELWDSIVLKDIVQRYKVRSVTELKAMLSIFRDSVTGTFSHRSLESAMLNRISIATVGKFLSFGQGAYLTFSLENFSFKARVRVASDKKAFLIDNGFYTSMKIGGQDDNGKLLENFLFITLLRKELMPNLDFFYYKTSSGKEVDFVVLESGRPSELLQVCWSMSNQKTLKREISSLAEAAVELKIKTVTIITAQEKAVYSENGIKIDVIPIMDYL